MQQRNYQQLIENSKPIYEAYSLLRMATHNHYNIQNADNVVKYQTFMEYLDCLISDNKNESLIKSPFIIEEIKYQIFLTKRGNAYEMELFCIEEITIPNELKKISNYTANDFGYLSREYPLTLHYDEWGKMAFNVKVTTGGQTFNIGGLNKIDLNAIHLDNFYDMLSYIKANPNELPSILVGMTTGTGKSFTQALWFLVLHTANIACFFSTETEGLVAQLKNAFFRLLPDEIVGDADQLPIMTYERLLSISVMSSLDEDAWIFIDEQHRAAQQNESLFRRISRLEKTHPIMFLTATPTKTTFNFCKKRILLSARQKGQLSLARLPEIVVVYGEDWYLKTLSDDVGKEYFTEEQKEEIRQGVSKIGAFPDSGAMAYIDKLRHTVAFSPLNHEKKYATEEELKKIIRWTTTLPIAEKKLVLVDNLAEIFNYAYSHGTEWIAPFYRSANFNKYGIRIEKKKTLFLQLLSKLNKEIVDKLRKMWEEYYNHRLTPTGGVAKKIFDHFSHVTTDQKVLQSVVTKINSLLCFKHGGDYRKGLVLHGIIETTLNYLMDCSSEDLDKARIENLDKLVLNVQQMARAKGNNPEGIKKFLRAKGLPDFLVEEIWPLMQSVINVINNKPDASREWIVDNWVLDIFEHYKGFLNACEISKAFKEFIKKHQTVYITNFEEKYSRIKPDRPFYDLKVKRYRLNSDKVRKRPHLKEAFLNPDNAGSEIEVMKPVYLKGYTEETVDILVDMGLVGDYVTNKKFEGYDNSKLTTVVLLCGDNTGQLANPDVGVQGVGRARGFGKQPVVFVAYNHKIKPYFSLGKLYEGEDFYGSLFNAREQYKSVFSKMLSDLLAKELQCAISRYIYSEKREADKFADQCCEIILKHFELLYNKMEYDFESTRKLFRFVLQDAYKNLYKQHKSLKNEVKNTFALVGIDNFILLYIFITVKNLIGRFIYALKANTHYDEFFRCLEKMHTPPEDNVPDTTCEQTYGSIITQYTLKDSYLIKNKVTAFLNTIEEELIKLDGLPNFKITAHMTYYFKEQLLILPLCELIESLKDDQLISLLAMLYPEESAECMKGQLRQLVQDYKTLTTKEFVDKYFSQDALFATCSKMTKEIVNVIVACQEYYHNFCDNLPLKTASQRLNLKEENDCPHENEIWKIRVRYESDFLKHHYDTIVKESTLLNAMPYLELLSNTKNRQMLTHLNELTDDLINPLSKEQFPAFKFFPPPPKSMSDLLMQTSQKLHQGITEGSSLSEQEIMKDQFKSGVDKIRVWMGIL